MCDEEKVQGAVEERESRAFARCRERGAFGELLAPFDIGGRERAKGARHLAEGEVRQVPRFQ